jgi:hypothetical protein
MRMEGKEGIYIEVKDVAGNVFACPLEALKTPGEVPADVLDACVDDATAGCCSGNFEIVKP